MRLGPGQRKCHIAAGKQLQDLVQRFSARGVNVHHCLRIQHEPTDRCGTLRDQCLDFFRKQIGIGKVEMAFTLINVAGQRAVRVSLQPEFFSGMLQSPFVEQRKKGVPPQEIAPEIADPLVGRASPCRKRSSWTSDR